MTTLQDLDIASIGQYGTYLLASKLWAKGYRAVLTSRNTKGVDLYVDDPETGKIVGVQVKTFRPKGKDHLKYFFPVSYGKSCEIDQLVFLYDFIFVEIQPDLAEHFYMVPKGDMVRLLKEHWESWRDHKHRIPFEEQSKKTIPLCLFVHQLTPYENKWENLGLE